MNPQKAELREIIQGTWSLLDPDHRALLANNRALLDTVLRELLPNAPPLPSSDIQQ